LLLVYCVQQWQWRHSSFTVPLPSNRWCLLLSYSVMSPYVIKHTSSTTCMISFYVATPYSVFFSSKSHNTYLLRKFHRQTLLQFCRLITIYLLLTTPNIAEKETRKLRW
jgi:hypothetical protein